RTRIRPAAVVPRAIPTRTEEGPMKRTWRVVLLAVVLAGALGWLALQVTTGVQADPQKTKPCGDTSCSVNELCCLTGCPPAYQCLPRRVGKCPGSLPCPPPASTSAQAPADSGD